MTKHNNKCLIRNDIVRTSYVTQSDYQIPCNNRSHYALVFSCLVKKKRYKISDRIRISVLSAKKTTEFRNLDDIIRPQFFLCLQTKNA